MCLGASWIHHYSPSNPLAQLAWSTRTPIGVPKGGSDLWLSNSGKIPIQQKDFDQALELYETIECQREKAAEKHYEICHPHSPFGNCTWEEYCQSMIHEPQVNDSQTSAKANKVFCCCQFAAIVFAISSRSSFPVAP